jgi:hypothetical protein
MADNLNKLHSEETGEAIDEGDTSIRKSGQTLTAEQVHGAGTSAKEKVTAIPQGYHDAAVSSENFSADISECPTPISAMSRETNNDSLAWETSNDMDSSLGRGVGSPSSLFQESESQISVSDKFDQQKGFLLNMSETSSTGEEALEGGRLWDMANQEAEVMKEKPQTEASARFARSILNLKSRAQVDIVHNSTESTLETIGKLLQEII